MRILSLSLSHPLQMHIIHRWEPWLMMLLLALPLPQLLAAEQPSAPPPGTQPNASQPGVPPKETQNPGDETAPKERPKEEPPKKTEYDKLPLPQLLAKANANNPVAQFELASRFNYGRGMPRNTNEAIVWLRKAARSGQEDAARLLAVKLFNGYDVPADHTEAMYWAQRLAEKNDLPAQLMVANMYANGEGTARDLVQSYKWYAIAAVAERPEANKDEPPRDDLLKSAAEQRDKIGSLLTEEEEKQAQKLASDWWLAKYGPPKPAAEKPKKTKKAKPQKKSTGGKPTI